MPIQSAWSDEQDTRAAVQEAYTSLCRKLRGTPGFVLLSFGGAHTPIAVAQALTELPDTVRFWGGAGYNGLITEDRVLVGDTVFGMLGSRMPDQIIGVAAKPRGSDMKTAAQSALLAAMADVRRSGELPNAVLFSCTPGEEERILEGLTEVVGDKVPLYGGGTCSDLATRNCTVVGKRDVFDCGVSVAAVYGEGLKSISFRSGYVPSSHGGAVTALDGKRRIMRIDNRPAADVYREWYKAEFGESLSEVANVVDELAQAPIGRQFCKEEHLDLFALSAILELGEDGALEVLTDIELGQPIRLMVGMRETMASRPARVINTAIELENVTHVHGAVVAFCAFLATHLRNDLETVRRNMCMAMMGRPFMVVFTCGEQGMLQTNCAVNGNLMVSALVFGS